MQHKGMEEMYFINFVNLALIIANILQLEVVPRFKLWNGIILMN